MYNYLKTLILFLLVSVLSFQTVSAKNNSLKTLNQSEITKDNFVKDNYTKQEVKIEMRDGVKLHTTIYSPKDTSKTYPYFITKNSI